MLAIHSGLAAIAKDETWELDEIEARKLASACDELASYYNIAPSEEVRVWLNFAGAAGSIYAPRFVAIAANKKRAKEKAKAESNVVRPPFKAAFPSGEIVT